MGLQYISGLKPWAQEVHKTASYTALQADTGTMFIFDSGTCVLTLPTLILGGGFYCFCINVSANSLTITAPANKLIVDGGATSTSGAYTSAGHIIGSACMVFLNEADTFFHMVNLGGTVVTTT